MAVFGPKYQAEKLLKELDSIPEPRPEVDINVLKAGMKGKSNAKLLANTLYMSCWCAAFEKNEFKNIPPRVLAFMLVRWPADREIHEVFSRMGDSILAHGGRNNIHYKIHCFYQVCVLLEPKGFVSEKIKSLSREEIVNIIASRGCQSLKGDIARMFYQFLRGGRWYGYIAKWKDWPNLTKKEVGYVAKRRNRERSSFSNEELQRLFAVSQANTRDHALLRFYIHTGCRKSAARELLVSDVWNSETGMARKMGVVLEKFNKQFRFPIDDILGAALSKWIIESNVKHYVFPALSDSSKKWNDQGPRKWIQELCAKANIFGSNVYVHGLRHTVATLLRKSGNDMEDIAAYLGHKSVSTTQIYIDSDAETLRDRMAIPWLNSASDMVGLRLSAGTINAITTDMGCTSKSQSISSSSSCSSGSDMASVMLHASEQQQQLVMVLTQRLAARENELARLTNLYNFTVGEVLTDVQRLVVGAWQKKQDEQAISQEFQDQIRQNYENHETMSDDEEDGDGDDIGNPSD